MLERIMRIEGGAIVQAMRHDAVTTIMRDVLNLGRARVSDIMEVRLDVEPIVAGLAAERTTASDLERLRDNLSAMPEEPGHALISWNVTFHRLVAQASHNPMYNIIVNILMDLTEDVISSLGPADLKGHDIKWHPIIFERIEKRDAEGAKRLFREHLEDVGPVLEDWENIKHELLLH